MRCWEMEHWAVVRVAGLTAALLPGLRLEQAPRLLDQLIEAEAAANALRPALVEALHEAVSQTGASTDTSVRILRRLLLKLKRDIFNQRPASLEQPAAGLLSPKLRAAVEQLTAVEQQVSIAAERYERILSEEWRATRRRLSELVQHPRLSNGLRLSSTNLADAVDRFARLPPDASLSKRNEHRLSSLGMYLLRAITRTTPFSTFAAIALVPLHDGAETERPSPIAWYSEPQLHTGLLSQWLARELPRRPRGDVPLRVTPLRRLNQEPSLTFPHALVDEQDQVLVTWYALQLNAAVAAIMASSGQTADEMVSRAFATPSEQQEYRRAILDLVDIGFLQPVYPRPEGTPRQLREMACLLRPYDVNVQPLEEAADLLDRYRTASPEERGRILFILKTHLGCEQEAHAALYEDVFLEPVSVAQLQVAPHTLSEDLAPVLHLAQASLTNAPHYLMCQAFLQRYGIDGQCDDIAAFLVDLLEEGELVSKLRYARMPLGWLKSPLVEASNAAGQAIVRCDPAWFAQLPRGDHPCAVALFVQVAAEGPDAVARGAYRVVLNEVQCGRHKYLSRFLAGDGAMARRALREIRADFAASDPLPVGVSPTLGLNFQLHPTICEWQIELPDESPSGAKILPLDDLRLVFDEDARQLRLSSKSLGREVEPLHSGFLRDRALPDALLLLRALSPRYRDDLLSERMAIYRTLDAMALANGESIPSFRPRLEVGRVVLERARWAVRLDEVPVPSSGEKHEEFFRRVSLWRRARELPQRAMVQRQVTKPGLEAISTPMYVDWHSPLTLTGIRPLVQGQGATREADGWLLLREVLPAPEDALFEVDGDPHIAEWMIQFRC